MFLRPVANSPQNKAPEDVQSPGRPGPGLRLLSVKLFPEPGEFGFGGVRPNLLGLSAGFGDDTSRLLSLGAGFRGDALVYRQTRERV